MYCGTYHKVSDGTQPYNTPNKAKMEKISIFPPFKDSSTFKRTVAQRMWH